MNGLQALNHKISRLFTGLFWAAFAAVTAFMEYSVIRAPGFGHGKHPVLSYGVCVVLLVPIVAWWVLMRWARRRGDARRARKAGRKAGRKSRAGGGGAWMDATAPMEPVAGQRRVPGQPPSFPAYRQGPYRRDGW